MNILGGESEVNEEIKTNFFESLKNENLTEIIKYFRNEEIKVWTYKEEEELSALHRASFMNLTLVVCAMIDEMKIRLGTDAKREIKKWVNEQTEQGFTALHYAAYRGNIEIINKLVENDAEVEVTNKRGLNVLHMAAQGNQPNALVYFKEKFSIEIQSVDDLGSTPLHWACYTGSETSVMFLLSWPQNINAQDREGLTPLHLAVMSERSRIIKKLLQKGACKKIKDSKGRTPYDLAVTKNKFSIVDMLKDQSSCQLWVFKAPLQKVSKNNFNIFLFFALHFVVESSVFFALLPCKRL
jgi:ankyrin repeat protein